MCRLVSVNLTQKTLASLIMPLCALLVGCPEQVTSGSCANVTVEQTSEDANNTESFSPFEANQCDISVGNNMLEIDILDRTTGISNPRVLFMVNITDNAVPGDEVIDLTRENDTDQPPALYQEFDSEATADSLEAAGPFWSSAAENAGTITFTTQSAGLIVADFEFNADNPSAAVNDAQGTLRISGQVSISQSISSGACGFGAPAMIVILLGLGFIRTGRRR